MRQIEFRKLHPTFTRYILTVQYFGPSFCGWQMQSTGIPLVLKGKTKTPSLDGVLNEALKGFAGEENFMNLKISSRTDAGVHAFRNTLQVDIRPRKLKAADNVSYSSANVLKALNYHLENYCAKEVLRVREVSRLGETAATLDPAENGHSAAIEPHFFDVKSMASSRTYSYRIFCDRLLGTCDTDLFLRPGSVHNRIAALNRQQTGSKVANNADYCGGGSSRLYKPDADELAARRCLLGDRSPALFTEQVAWDVPCPLDVSTMHRAAQLFVGVHDFTTFRSVRCDSVSPFRDVMAIRVEKVTPSFGGTLCTDNGVVGTGSDCTAIEKLRLDTLSREQLQLNKKDLVVVTITASSFVRRMVRNIVSALVHVGRGKFSDDRIHELLLIRDRQQLTREGCEPAPAHGLYLMDVNYDLSVEELHQRRRRWQSICTQ